MIDYKLNYKQIYHTNTLYPDFHNFIAYADFYT